MNDQLVHILRQTEESYRGIHPGIRQKFEGWEKWYAQWLLTLVDIKGLIGISLSQPTLERLLLRCDQEYLQQAPDQEWSEFVAQRMLHLIDKHINATKNTDQS